MKVQRLLEYDCFFCDVCREYVYDESEGDQEREIKPKTKIDELSKDWCCPICGADKSSLRASTLTDEYWQDPAAGALLHESESVGSEFHSRYRRKHAKKK